MKIAKLLFCMAVIALFACLQASADTVLFTDDFESYNVGGLDQNYYDSVNQTYGPNVGVNGDLNGNPWVGWGPNATNFLVMHGIYGYDPHGGLNEVAGDPAGHPGYCYLNLAYRFGNGQKIPGSLQCDFWYRDPNGKDSTNACQDYAFLGNYTSIPGDMDYTEASSGGLSGVQSQLCLGMYAASGSADYGAYQARIFTLDSGKRNYLSNLPNQSGWWNLPIRRTAAWHQMRIIVGPLLSDNTNTVAFFVDDMDHAGLVYNTLEPCGGYNIFNLLGYRVYNPSRQYDTRAYYDDVTITKIDPACTVEGVKDAVVGTLVSADGVYITAIGSGLPTDTAYVQTANGTSSVKIHYSNPNDVNITGVNAAHYSGLSEMNLAVGTRISAMGRLQVTAAGEKYIEAYSVSLSKDVTYDTNGTPNGSTIVIVKQKPVGMNNLAAASTLVQGKFVKAWGVVSNVVSDGFTIDDGSNSPIKVYSGSIAKPTEGSYVSVSGALGRDVNGLALYMNDDPNDLN